ncbi:MAG: hypothetical protein ACRCUT_13560, partial [Spirochaetota bacterium]
MIKIFPGVIKGIFGYPESGVDNSRIPYLSYNSIYVFSFFGHILFIPVFVLLGNPFALTNNILCIAVDIVCLLLNSRRYHLSSLLLWVFEISYHST